MLAEAVLIVSAVLFMLVYSAVIHPGEQAAFYDARARVLLPYVAIIVSFPLFYFLSSRFTGGWRNALAFWGFHVALDVAISAAADGVNGLLAILPRWLISQSTKLLGCRFGAGNLKH